MMIYCLFSFVCTYPQLCPNTHTGSLIQQAYTEHLPGTRVRCNPVLMFPDLEREMHTQELVNKMKSARTKQDYLSVNVLIILFFILVFVVIVVFKLGTASLRASQFLNIEDCLRHTFHMQTQQLQGLPPPLSGSWSHPYSPSQGPSTRLQGTVPYPTACQSQSNQPIHNLYCLTCFFPLKPQ